MIYRLLADAVLLLHLAFIAFVVAGGLFIVRWPRLPWLHAPAVLWGVAIELCGCICPLTPLENWLRQAGGSQGYASGFTEHYLLPLIYPAELTRELQLVLGLGVLVLNGLVYAVWYAQGRKKGGD